MSEATLIFQNMRGGCATVGNTVHTLFRVNGRRPGLREFAKDAAAAPDRRLAPEAESAASIDRS